MSIPLFVSTIRRLTQYTAEHMRGLFYPFQLRTRLCVAMEERGAIFQRAEFLSLLRIASEML